MRRFSLLVCRLPPLFFSSSSSPLHLVSFFTGDVRKGFFQVAAGGVEIRKDSHAVRVADNPVDKMAGKLPTCLSFFGLMVLLLSSFSIFIFSSLLFSSSLTCSPFCMTVRAISMRLRRKTRQRSTSWTLTTSPSSSRISLHLPEGSCQPVICLSCCLFYSPMSDPQILPLPLRCHAPRNSRPQVACTQQNALCENSCSSSS